MQLIVPIMFLAIQSTVYGVNISLETDLQQAFAGATIIQKIDRLPIGTQISFVAVLAKSKKEIIATNSPSLGYWVRYRKYCWQRYQAEECFKFLQTEYQVALQKMNGSPFFLQQR